MQWTRNTLLVVICFVLAFPVFAEDELLPLNEDDPILGGPFSLEFRAGYTGTMWVPQGLEPYELGNYGRDMFYAELAVLHPLLVLGEAFNILQAPRLRIETNFGYSANSSGFYELIPRTIRNSPYLKTSGWVTAFQWFSFRYNEEKFDASLIDPRAIATDELGRPTVVVPSMNVTNHMRDLEIGVVTSPSGELQETMVEIGYYRSTMIWPMVISHTLDDFGEYNLLVQKDLIVEGMYGALHTRPIPGVWPMDTFLMLRAGNAIGVDARFRYERELQTSWFLGVELDARYRIITKFEDERNDVYSINSNNPRDLRYKLTLYTAVVLF